MVTLVLVGMPYSWARGSTTTISTTAATTTAAAAPNAPLRQVSFPQSPSHIMARLRPSHLPCAVIVLFLLLLSLPRLRPLSLHAPQPLLWHTVSCGEIIHESPLKFSPPPSPCALFPQRARPNLFSACVPIPIQRCEYATAIHYRGINFILI